MWPGSAQPPYPVNTTMSLYTSQPASLTASDHGESNILEEAQGEQGQDLWTLQSPFKTTPNPGVISCSVRPLPPPKPPADQFCLMPQPALAPLPSLVKSSLCKWPPTCPAATILKSCCMGCFCFSLLNWPLIFICWAGALNSVPPTRLLAEPLGFSGGKSISPTQTHRKTLSLQQG